MAVQVRLTVHFSTNGSMGNSSQIKEWKTLEALVAQARNQSRMLTNFFPDEQRMSGWCTNGKLTCGAFGKTTCLVHDQGTFSNLYFLTEKAECLQEDVGEFLKTCGDARIVVDVLGPDRVRIPLEEALKSNGFSLQTVLQRMGRKTPAEVVDADMAVVCATDADVGSVKALLDEYFNAEQEQLPTADELKRWVERGELKIVRHDDAGVDGFVIYDLSPAQLYLRYWFVHPEARGNGIGGKLMRTMFAAAAQTKRQYFWVKTDNENAIIRYQHYGFGMEPMKDSVWARGGKE